MQFQHKTDTLIELQVIIQQTFVSNILIQRSNQLNQTKRNSSQWIAIGVIVQLIIFVKCILFACQLSQVFNH